MASSASSDDRQGDQRLDDVAGAGDDAGGGERQRDGVGEGEGGDLQEQGIPAAGVEIERDHEQDVVEALRQDVLEAELDERADIVEPHRTSP